ncbi:MAG TPA: DbpA RNA binding domain-containing protein, partial [Humisphaera sp.]
PPRPAAPEPAALADDAPRLDRRGPAPGMTRVYVGTGRAFGITPQALVDAISNISGIPKEQIGGVELADRFSVVEFPEPVVQIVLRAMRQKRIGGRKIAIRRFIEGDELRGQGDEE